MRTIILRSQFKKDYKKCRSRGLDLTKYRAVVDLLVKDKPLPEFLKAHRLAGQYKNLWECHVTSDWLLIYYPDASNNLVLYRMGTHSDLF